MKSGIYTITNVINNKIYVGYATNLYKRINTHKSLLINSKHPNNHLQNSVTMFGINNFLFEILEECEKEFLCSQEHYWATILNVHNRKFGYNEKPTNPYGIPHKLSNETILKFKSRKLNEKQRAALIKSNKNRIRTKESINKAKETLRKNAAINGYYRSKESINKQVESRKWYKHSIQTKEKFKKPILQYSIENIFVKEWSGAIDILKCIKGNPKSLRKACNIGGKYKNFIWKFKN